MILANFNNIGGGSTTSLLSGFTIGNITFGSTTLQQFNIPQVNQPIIKPVNSVNFPTKPINSAGLSTLLPIKDIGDIKPIGLESLLVEEIRPQQIDISNQSVNLVINVVSDVYVNVPDIREITYPKEVRGADFIGYDVDFDISWNSVDTTVIRMYIGASTEYVQLGPRDRKSVV